MVQRRPLKLPGLPRLVDEIQSGNCWRSRDSTLLANCTFLGPWYSGQFAKNWVVRVGDVRIPATVEREHNKREPRKGESWNPTCCPSLRGTGQKKVVGYTIDNRTTYRRNSDGLSTRAGGTCVVLCTSGLVSQLY